MFLAILFIAGNKLAEKLLSVEFNLHLPVAVETLKG